MRLYYIGTAPIGSRWQGTQDAAHHIRRANPGTSFVQRDVPTDKEGLLGFLNNEANGTAPQPDAPLFEREPRGHTAEENSAPWNAKPDQCRSCASRDPASLERAAKALAAGANASAIAERIMELDGFELGLLAQAVAERFKQIARVPA